MFKIRKILTPIDFSDRSPPAVVHAVNIAKHFNAEVIFFHAVPTVPYDAAFASGFPAGFFWNLGVDAERHLGAKLDALVEEIVPGHPGERIIASGSPAPLIRDAVEKYDVDLIVMPTSGAGPFRRLLLGSTTAKVLNDVECPVFTGSHVENIDAFALRPYKRIGCAIDLRSDADRLLRCASDFAAAYRADVLAIYAIPAIPDRGEVPEAPRLTTLLREHAKQRTLKLVKNAQLEVPVIIGSGEPREAVKTVSQEQDLDLIVVDRQNELGLFGGLNNNTYGIIANASCPALTV